jgi:outer membrane protein TolC
MTTFVFVGHARAVFVTLLVAAAVTGRQVVGEREVVMTALERNADITVVGFDLRSDSLDREASEAAWLPTAEVAVSGRIEPYVEKPLPTTAGSALSLTAGQAVPGGGTVSASMTTERTRYLAGDTLVYPSTIAVGYHQPLLRGAWRNGEVEYAVRVRRLDSHRFTLEQTSRLVALLSEVRRLYWDSYEKQMLYGIYEGQVAYKRSQLESARQRLALGTVSQLDTLSARYEYLQATQALLGAQIADSLARRALARELAMEVEELALDTGQGLTPGEVPRAESFLRDAERFDPALRVFEVLRDKLALEAGHARNRLYPDLSAGVDYVRSLEGDAPLTGDRGVAGNTVFSLILTYSLPTRTRRIEEHKVAIAAQTNDLRAEDRRAELTDRVNTMLLSWQQELRAIQVAEASFEVAAKKVEAARVGFEVGTVDRVSLLKDESDYLDAATGLLRRKIALKRLEIACDELTGAVLERFGVTLR